MTGVLYLDGATLLVHVGAEAGGDPVLAHQQDLGPEVSRGHLEHPGPLRGEVAAEEGGALEGGGPLRGEGAAPRRGALDDAVAREAGVVEAKREAAVGPERRPRGSRAADPAEQVLREPQEAVQGEIKTGKCRLESFDQQQNQP